MVALKQVWADAAKVSLGDLLVLLSAVGSTEANENPGRFANQVGIRYDGLKEVHKLRRLVHHSVRHLMDDDAPPLERKIKPPTPTQCKLLGELFLSGFGDQERKYFNPYIISDTNINHSSKHMLFFILKYAYLCSVHYPLKGCISENNCSKFWEQDSYIFLILVTSKYSRKRSLFGQVKEVSITSGQKKRRKFIQILFSRENRRL